MRRSEANIYPTSPWHGQFACDSFQNHVLVFYSVEQLSDEPNLGEQKFNKQNALELMHIQYLQNAAESGTADMKVHRGALLI